MDKPNVVLYQSTDGAVRLDVTVVDDNVWLDIHQIAQLFDRDEKTIRKHLANAQREELEGLVVVAKFATTTKHGAMQGKMQTREVSYYNL